MANTPIRQKLHQYIDITDDAKIDALYTLLQNDMEQNFVYSVEELDMLHNRAEVFLKGESKTYSIQESHNKIRQQRK